MVKKEGFVLHVSMKQKLVIVEWRKPGYISFSDYQNKDLRVFLIVCSLRDIILSTRYTGSILSMNRPIEDFLSPSVEGLL